VNGKDDQCSGAADITREACFAKSKPCMWLSLEDKNLCLPCEWSEIHMPCPPAGAIFGKSIVYQCDMTCPHREVITKVSACTDIGGAISQEDCFKKGDKASTSCMWTSFTSAAGLKKSVCGPCQVGGYGVVPKYAPGNIGPEANSIVISAASQCEPTGTADCEDEEDLPEKLTVESLPAEEEEADTQVPMSKSAPEATAPAAVPQPPTGLRVSSGPAPLGITGLDDNGAGPAPAPAPYMLESPAASPGPVVALQLGTAPSPRFRLKQGHMSITRAN